MPPGVSMVKLSRLARPWSRSHLEKMRRPLPDFSASLPSGLKMRRPKSAPVVGGTSSRMPSEPMPQLRSQISAICAGVSGAVRSLPSMTM
jgi:hypothetical protein